MDSAEDVSAHLNRLHEAVWELTAIALALGQRRTAPELREAAEEVLLQAGLMQDANGRARPAPGVATLAGSDPSRLGAQAATGILQSAALLSGADAWTGQADEAILAQGRASAQAAQPFKAFAVPMMPGLEQHLSSPSPVMLDVGVGVAAMAVAFCEAFPRLRVVGLDVFPRALELAGRTVDEADMRDRIELRQQNVVDLKDEETFCLAWLPAPFLPRTAIDTGLSRVSRALVPGGWLVVGHGKFSTATSGALTRLQTVAFGGTPLDNDEAQEALRTVGLEQVITLPTPPGAPAITVGRRARASSVR